MENSLVMPLSLVEADAIELLRADHSSLTATLAKLAARPRRQGLAQASRDLRVHARLERLILLPQCQQLALTSRDQRTYEEAIREASTLEELAARIAGSEPRPAEKGVEFLHSAAVQHAELANRWFEPARRALGRAGLVRLAETLRSRREEWLREVPLPPDAETIRRSQSAEKAERLDRGPAALAGSRAPDRDHPNG